MIGVARQFRNRQKGRRITFSLDIIRQRIYRQF